jgi:hypothetical protein
VEGFTHPTDADRELDELRARAYGPDADIAVDPAALARLRELEAAHRADAERRAVPPTRESAAGTEAAPTAAPEPLRTGKEGSSRSLLQRATAMGRSRLAWAGGALIIAGGVVATAFLISAPRPDATLHPTAAAADDLVRSRAAVEASTLRGYGSYHGLEIWSGVNALDSPCLVAFDRASGRLSEMRCAPFPAELIMDVSSSGDEIKGFDGLAGEGIIRFILRGDTVDAYIHLMPEAD